MLLGMMTIPELVVDEDIRGWFLRMAEENGWDIQSFCSAFFPENCDVGRDGLPNIRGYADLYGKYREYGFPDPHTALYRHTTYMVSGLFSPPYCTGMLADRFINGTDTEPIERLVPQMSFRYCPVCAQKDRKAHGAPVVHVPHQVQGVDACFRHGVMLSEDPDGAVVRADEAAVRTAEAVHMLFRTCATGSIGDIRPALKARMKEKGIRLPAGMVKYPVDTDALRNAATVFSDEELTAFFLYDETAVKKECAEAVKILSSSSEVVEYDLPMVVYRCGRCGKTTESHYITLTTGGICPRCSASMDWQTKAEIRIRYSAGKEYEVSGFPDTRHVDIRHIPCGKERKGLRLKNILNTGIPRCPFCAENERQSHIGEKLTMNCGIPAVITRFGTVVDIDLRFEDGRVCRGAAYAAFLKGEIIPEGFYEERHIGETRTMRNGLDGTITAWKDKNHVTVRLSNGDVAVVSYQAFLKRYVKSETLEEQRRNSHIGEVYRQKCGLDAVITRYVNAINCTCRFSNGETREGVRYHKLRQGSVLPPSMQKGNHSDRRQK